ncbi:hypothetical protein BASA81_004142 [Batrachochytrium salamandrivorans]|nr:hypothetical protein BASA81_004142 [Batrachochytrium salamandrivorans]
MMPTTRQLMRLAKIAVVMVYLISKLPTTGGEEAAVQASRQVLGSGMHLVLETVVPCEGGFGLVERFPHQVFVDQYQVAELQRVYALAQHEYEVKTEPKLDLEAMANTKEVFTLWARTNQRRIQLPLHVRYHAAKADGRYEQITLPAPLVVCAMHCAEMSAASPHDKGEGDLECVKRFGPGFQAYQAEFDPIVFTAPVGDLNQSQWVFALSLLAVLLGSLAIVKTVRG